MRIKTYLQEVYTELIHKVSWPTWKDLQSSAIIVMIASLLISLVIFFMDFSFENVMDFIYNMMH